MLTLSCLASAVIHVPLYFGARWVSETYMTSEIRITEPAKPVQMVQLSKQAWDKSMSAARKTARNSPSKTTAAKSDPAKPKAKEPKPEAKKKPKKDKITGQIVEVPPTADDRANPDAKFLSKYNSTVKKQSMARMEERDPTKRRVTNRLQEKNVAPARPQPGALPTKGLTLEGRDDKGTQSGEGPADQKAKKKTIIQVPDVAQKDDVQLKLSDLPGRSLSMPNQRGTDALKGNGDELKLQLGDDLFEVPALSGGKRGSKDAKVGLPSLAALRPTIGTIARISGSPSNDHVENVPEGDGTFLNTKEFKHATFFYRVKDSVAGHWNDMLYSAYRRRDPTGNIYGIRDRATLLSIELSLDGSLNAVRIVNSSGVDFLDTAAVQAFERGSPFPNPPAAIADDDGNIRFTFQFSVVHSGRSFRLFR